MNEFITILKVLWLCIIIYFLVKDSILAYIAVKVFLKTGDSEIEKIVQKIPNNIALRVVNVVLFLTLEYF